MSKMSQEDMGLLRDPAASKVLATVDADGMPHMAPKGSLTALDEDTLAFVEREGGKSRANLEVGNRVAAAAFKSAAACQVQGVFQGFQSGGPLFDQYIQVMNASGMPARAAADIQDVGIIKIR